jgi:hypothetical protein
MAVLGAVDGGNHIVYENGEALSGQSYESILARLMDELKLAETDGRRSVIRDLLKEYKSIRERLAGHLGFSIVAEKKGDSA